VAFLSPLDWKNWVEDRNSFL